MTAIDFKSFDDVVFQGRNQAYGAYQLRKNENRNFLIAMCIVFSTIGVAWSAERVASLFASPQPSREVIHDFPGEVNPDHWKEENTQSEIAKSGGKKTLSSESNDFTLTDKKPSNSLVYNPDVYTAATEEEPGLDTEIGEGEGKGNGSGEGNGNSDCDTLLGEHTNEKEQIQIVEHASFPGGEEMLEVFIKKNFDFPEKEDASGILVMYFEIDELGQTKNVKVIKSFPRAESFEKEAIRVLYEMPAWTPKKINGKPVMTRREIKINCKL